MAQESGSAAANITRDAVHVLREYTGRGPTKAKTIIEENLVSIIVADPLTKGETKLVENGHSERVLELRHEFQQVMRDDLVAVVERELDRKVIAFMSDNHIDPDYGVETFVLESEGEPV